MQAEPRGRSREPLGVRSKKTRNSSRRGPGAGGGRGHVRQDSSGAARTGRATRGPWRMLQPRGRGARGRPWTAVGPAAPDRPAARSGKGLAARPPRTHRAPRPHPSGPRAGSERRQRRRRLSRGGHGPGEGKGKHPGARGAPGHPLGALSGSGKGAGGGGGAGSGPPGPRALPGPLWAPGGGVAGPSRAPAPLHKQAPDAEPPGSAGGGAGRGGGRAAR